MRGKRVEGRRKDRPVPPPKTAGRRKGPQPYRAKARPTGPMSHRTPPGVETRRDGSPQPPGLGVPPLEGSGPPVDVVGWCPRKGAVERLTPWQGQAPLPKKSGGVGLSFLRKHRAVVCPPRLARPHAGDWAGCPPCGAGACGGVPTGWRQGRVRPDRRTGGENMIDQGPGVSSALAEQARGVVYPQLA